MATRISGNFATAELNKAVDIGVPEQAIESIGPVALHLHNQGVHNVVLSVRKRSDDSIVATDRDTEVASEDTTYDGDGSTLVFTGQALAHTPAVPGSVKLVDAGSVAPDLVDKNLDGNLYTDDVDEDFAGTVDYFTGDLNLSYPAGKAPGTGADAIEANYNYQDELLIKGGKRIYQINNVLHGEELVPAIACDGVGSMVKIESVTSWT